MTRRTLSMLVVLNAVLLAALSMTVLSPRPAMAQFGGGSNYRMISGQVPGRGSVNPVYVVDLNTTTMVAILYDARNNNLKAIAKTNVKNDVRNAGGGR